MKKCLVGLLILTAWFCAADPIVFQEAAGIPSSPDAPTWIKSTASADQLIMIWTALRPNLVFPNSTTNKHACALIVMANDSTNGTAPVTIYMVPDQVLTNMQLHRIQARPPLK